MSASNWAVCPRCAKRLEAMAEALLAEIATKYGQIPIDEFDALQRRLAECQNAKPEATLREDYEFYGAEDGTVVAEYGCTCTKCGLTADFTYRHELDV
jgi:hypothetical protein